MQKLIEAESFLTDKVPARWTGIKYLERDEDVIVRGRMVNSALSSTLENMARDVAVHTQKTLKAQPDALIADHRYGFIAGMIKDVVSYPVLDADRISRSDQMDKVLTHTFLGPLIMLAVVYMIYQITFQRGRGAHGLARIPVRLARRHGHKRPARRDTFARCSSRASSTAWAACSASCR